MPDTNSDDDRRRDLTWDEFKEMVIGKFFPRVYRKQKEMELMNLEQRTMTILDLFEYGLRPEIGGILARQGATSTFSKMVE